MRRRSNASCAQSKVADELKVQGIWVRMHQAGDHRAREKVESNPPQSSRDDHAEDGRAVSRDVERIARVRVCAVRTP